MPKVNPPEINVEKTIEAAGHSEELIRRLVAEGVHNKQIHDTIKRNTDHLSFILERKAIVDSNSPRLDGFREAITLGEQFIAEE